MGRKNKWILILILIIGTCLVFLGRRDTTDDKPEEQLVEGIYDGRLLMLV